MRHQTSTSTNQVACKSNTQLLHAASSNANGLTNKPGSNPSLTSFKSQSDINDTDMSSNKSDEEYNEGDEEEQSVNNDRLVHSKASKKRRGHCDFRHTWAFLNTPSHFLLPLKLVFSGTRSRFPRVGRLNTASGLMNALIRRSIGSVLVGAGVTLQLNEPSAHRLINRGLNSSTEQSPQHGIQSNQSASSDPTKSSGSSSSDPAKSSGTSSAEPAKSTGTSSVDQAKSPGSASADPAKSSSSSSSDRANEKKGDQQSSPSGSSDSSTNRQASASQDNTTSAKTDSTNSNSNATNNSNKQPTAILSNTTTAGGSSGDSSKQNSTESSKQDSTTPPTSITTPNVTSTPNVSLTPTNSPAPNFTLPTSTNLSASTATLAPISGNLSTPSNISTATVNSTALPLANTPSLGNATSNFTDSFSPTGVPLSLNSSTYQSTPDSGLNGNSSPTGSGGSGSSGHIPVNTANARPFTSNPATLPSSGSSSHSGAKMWTAIIGGAVLGGGLLFVVLWYALTWKMRTRKDVYRDMEINFGPTAPDATWGHGAEQTFPTQFATLASDTGSGSTASQTIPRSTNLSRGNTTHSFASLGRSDSNGSQPWQRSEFNGHDAPLPPPPIINPTHELGFGRVQPTTPWQHTEGGRWEYDERSPSTNVQPCYVSLDEMREPNFGRGSGTER
ncbi:hypothetical protein CROQUDRAFT_107897 [Cronartium quercuum f. sp. fusiforme G11]|uniref:Uncharacterized protein n=1 Tax=Cronartium quercuum f. sp. fusiforme G11 TaxID=708437 RepID=A0A9P6NJP6_9BASI|nr:hypothetical protein CROQUDRAFT_107897 [Cronartium quercuum f. sp. fusiforme G11]